MKIILYLILAFTTISQANSQANFDIAQIEDDVTELLKHEKYDETKQLLHEIRTTNWSELDCKEQAIIYRLFGNLHYYLYEDAKALTYYTDSSYQKVKECNAIDLENHLLNNIGTIYQIQKQQLLASKYFNKLRINYLSGSVSPTKKMCQHLVNLASFYDNHGDLYNSFLCAWKAKQIAEDLNLDIARIYSSLGIYFERTKQYQEALNNYSKAIEISLVESNTIPIPFQYQQALTYRYMEEYAKALEILDQIESQKTTDDEQYNVINLKAIIYAQQGKYEASEDLFLQLEKDSVKNIRKFSHYENWADLKLEMGDFSGAIEIYKKRIANIQSKWSHLNYIPTSSSDLLQITELKCLVSKALYLQSHKGSSLARNQVIENYDDIQKNVGQIIKSNWESQSSSHLLHEIYPNLYYLIMCHLDEYNDSKNANSIEEAYQILSTFKNQILEREIQSRKRLKENLADSTLSKYYSLKSQINKKYVEKDISEDSKIQIIESFEKYQLKFDSILITANSSPTLQPKSLSEIQKSLSKNDRLLDVYFAEDKLICFWINKDDIKVNATEFHTHVLVNFLEKIKIGKPIDQSINDSLFNALFAGIDIEETTNIIVHADGLFQKLPFGALQNPKTKNFLIEKISFRYILSTDALYTENYKWSGNQCLGIASNYSLKTNENIDSSGIRFSQLTGTIEEINDLFRYYKTDSLVNRKATFSNLSNQIKNKDYNIIQLSLHGMLDDRFPALSGLIFENQKGIELIDLNRMMGLNFNTDLTIVNSCHSGDGEHITGEAISNLNTSLFISGSKANIVNLWSSSDKASSEILINFHKEISNGNSKSKALQLAKINYLQNASPTFKHPKYWSSLVLFGNDSPKQKSNFIQPIYLFMGLLFAFLFYFFIKRFK